MCRNPDPARTALYERVVKDCLTLCRALGYDLNTVEFAVQDGIPYAIDFLNPAPDADYHSVGRRISTGSSNAVAEFAIEQALQEAGAGTQDLRWARFVR